MKVCEDCRGECVPDGCGTGYARFTEPDGNERTVCYRCADRRQRETVAKCGPGDTFTAYIDGKGHLVTTWTGGRLMDVTREHTGRAGFGGRMHYWRARDPLGRHWWGRNAGRGMVVHLHQCR